MIRKILKWIAFGTIVLLAVAMLDFLIWRNQHIRSLESNSRLIQTARGVVEYSTTGSGSGPAVLALHGSLGGYDQGQMMAQMLVEPKYQLISVSRPGYLRTPLETGATFEQQADAYAGMLDEMRIDKVAVIATSGGGPSALQFALRHPDRCWAMILIAANSDDKAGKSESKQTTNGDNQTPAPPAWLTNILLSDFTGWTVDRLSLVIPDQEIAFLVGEAYVPVIKNDPEKYRAFKAFLDSIALFSHRRDGAFNDGKQMPVHTGYPFEKITCPTLILLGTQDNLISKAQQDYLRETLPNAQYREIQGGTHFMVISHAEVMEPLITDFLNSHVP